LVQEKRVICISMKICLSILAIVFALPYLSSPAYADACSNGARALVDGKPNSTLLSVKSKQGSNGKVTCEARIKISSGSQPPRIVVKKFKP